MPTPPFHLLLDAIAVCRGAKELELLDRTIATALAAVTGEVPPRQWKPVVMEAARSFLRATTYAQVPADASKAAAALRNSYAKPGISVAEEAEEVARRLDELAVLLADEEPASLVSACSRLRDFDRPDLGAAAASVALARDPSMYPALTTRAGALLDLADLTAAIEDATLLEASQPSAYSANVWSRLERMRGSPEKAMKWARLANERDPAGVAGMLSLAGAAKVAGDIPTLEWAAGHIDRTSTAPRSVNYPVFIAAKDLLRGGDTARAVGMLTELAAEHYAPAERLLLEHNAGTSRRRVLQSTPG